jgi:hypothetical protein
MLPFRKKTAPHILADLGPLYHSYKLFGIDNEQKPAFMVNQRCKEPILRAYTQYALAKCTCQAGDEVSFAELFCADGYFAMVAARLGATRVYGYDDDSQQHFGVARTIAERLALPNVEFIKADVNSMDEFDRVDVVANIGGLYHVLNPIEILRKSYSMARRYLIVQTVVSQARSEADYFEAPGPGWQHGCRFSQASFDAVIKSQGWNIVDEHFNELLGNERLEDRGSSYYLIQTG